jgi:sarcosine oxidase subunit gamma
VFDRTSPLERQLTAGGRDGCVGSRAVEVKELRGWYLTQLAAFRGREPDMAQGLAKLLGIAAAPAPGVASVTGRNTLLRTAPGQYWLVTTDITLDRALRAAVPALDGSVTPLSHSRVRLAVSGPGARVLLAKGISVDLRPERLRVGDFVETGLHHTGILLHRAGEDRYELYLLKTYAVSQWEWLIDAALPLGFDVGIEDLRTA